MKDFFERFEAEISAVMMLIVAFVIVPTALTLLYALIVLISKF